MPTARPWDGDRMAELTLTDVTKVYTGLGENIEAVSELSLSIPDGELLVVVGPSGCGKSTTLRMIAGLETVTEGTIAIDGAEIQWMSPRRRDIAMVFQSYALYQKMTVRENMEYGLKHSTDRSPSDRQRRVERIANLLDIEELLDDRPAELSGGQKQRVALGRAIVREPDVFLLDEPLSNLDAKLRAHMRTELQRIHEQIGVTTVYVTHNQKEAMTVADRIAVLNGGVLQQVAKPETAYRHPTNEFVATFLGSPSMNVFDASVSRTDGQYQFARAGIDIARVPVEAVDGELGDTVRFGVRPEDLRVSAVPGGESPAVVSVTEYQGKENYVHLELDGVELTARVQPDVRVERGTHVDLQVESSAAYVFDPATSRSLKTYGLDAPVGGIGATD
jgi:multiple sugar transport system ATP-binding protein